MFIVSLHIQVQQHDENTAIVYSTYRNCGHRMCLGCSGSRCRKELITIVFLYRKEKRHLRTPCSCSRIEYKQILPVTDLVHGKMQLFS
jgi:hypothetical protein